MKRRLERKAIAHRQAYKAAWGEELEARKIATLSSSMASERPDKKEFYKSLGVRTTGSEAEEVSRNEKLIEAADRLSSVLRQAEAFAIDNQAALRSQAIKDARKDGVQINF